jgi:phosphohistidine swiveling domain-containing protein
MISNTNITDLLQNITIEDSQYVGDSVALLGHLAREKLPIPAGFVLSYLVLQNYFDLTEIRLYYQKARLEEDSSHIIQVIKNTSFPKTIHNNISALYSKISGFSDATVNIRALILNNQSEELEHKPYEVYGVKGIEYLVKSIHDIYVQILEDQQTKLNFFFDNVYKIVVIVQKSIQCEISGHVYTSDMVTHDNTKLHIEAYFGLYEEAEKLGIQPDLYIYDKTADKIEEKYVSYQEHMFLRHQSVSEPIQKVVISPSWKKKQKLDDKHIIVLAKTGKIIEEELGNPQHVIWSYEAGKIWIHFVQSINKKHSIETSDSIQKRVVLTNNAPENPNNLKMPVTKEERKDVLVNFVFNDKDMNDTTKEKQEHLNNYQTNTNVTHERKAVLLEGKHYAGMQEAEGIATFSHENAGPHNILILRGDENISSNLKVAGLIIEEDSDILAQRLYEYFKAPVITGVPLVHKIIKEGEKIAIDPITGQIFEFIRSDYLKTNYQSAEKNSAQKIEPEEESSPMEFATDIPDDHHADLYRTNKNLNSAQIQQKPESQEIGDVTTTNPHHFENDVSLSQKDKANWSFDSKRHGQQHLDTNKESSHAVLYEDSKVRIERKFPLQYSHHVKSSSPRKKDLSQILNLIEEDFDLYDVNQENPQLSIVEGVSTKDQMKIWGRSLEQIINSSKELPENVALEVLESTIEEASGIQQTSKELEFDREQDYISQKMHHRHKKSSQPEEFIPTATKVYIHLIDELIPTEKQNYDGIVFSSTKEPEVIITMLETILERVREKEVLLILPPYETSALDYLLQQIYRLRNQGYKNLSLISPDYRNKSSIIAIKKRIAAAGLTRSTSFRIYANVSRTINVFRLSELHPDIIDGVYIDLFRIKMNMLGIEKQTASTKYLKGMRNLVEYISETLRSKHKSLLDISCFHNLKKVVQHVSSCGFWGIVCELAVANQVKQYIRDLETSQLNR